MQPNNLERLNHNPQTQISSSITGQTKDEDKKSYRLSRYFKTYSSNEIMGKTELNTKSIIALTLGITPFAIFAIAKPIFQGFAYIGNFLEKQMEGKNKSIQIALKVSSLFIAVPATLSAAIMLSATKVFSLSQKLVWGHYVAKPTGDGPNTRIAQYGSSNQPWKDLKCIIRALFVPNKLTADEWKLEQWRKISI